ncbi:MAG TPA: hypothetical protein DIU15_03260, partial [Deltaproteobacteria bacterium]|nr:hypothetical protein [Deltaproteobacteria bacterium]
RLHDGHWLAAAIVEAEAYCIDERASHSSKGRTPSREPMFMAPGTLYMYYSRAGDSLNLSCRGEGNAVLVKAARPYVDALSPAENLEVMQSLNPGPGGRTRDPSRLCSGQTLLCRSLALTVKDWNGKVFDPDRFRLEDVGCSPQTIIQAPRLGIPQGRDEHLLYRFVDRDFAHLSTSNPLTRRAWREGRDYRLVRRRRSPSTELELVTLARSLAGRSLGWLAGELGWDVPADLRRKKGWVGRLLEEALGCTAGSLAEPDFPHLGIELKTIPVDGRGVPRETTHVCTAPLDGTLESHWEHSWVRRKLSCVLWVPVVGDSSVPVAERRIGAAVLWRPDEEETARLRQDWEEITELIAQGEHGMLDGRVGDALHLRPKAASGRSMTWALDSEGQWVPANPRGFYLRTTFTRRLLSRNLLLEA